MSLSHIGPNPRDRHTRNGVKHNGANGTPYSHSQDVIRAYHEAAHGLAAYLMNRHFHALSIRNGEHSHEKLPANRWENFKPGKCSDPSCRDRVERNIIELFAGDVAQEILTGKPVARGESLDYHQIAELGTYVMEAGEVLDAYLHYMALRTKHILLQPQNWDAIQMLADALIKHKRLEYDAARRILDEAMDIGLKDLMHHYLSATGPLPKDGGKSRQ